MHLFPIVYSKSLILLTEVYFQSRYGELNLDSFSCYSWCTPRGLVLQLMGN